MCTDLPDSFRGHSFLGLCGYTMSQRAAQQCFSEASMTTKDVDIVELHDCFAPNEVSILPEVSFSRPRLCCIINCSHTYIQCILYIHTLIR